jgi:hypothetical protein
MLQKCRTNHYGTVIGPIDDRYGILTAEHPDAEKGTELARAAPVEMWQVVETWPGADESGCGWERLADRAETDECFLPLRAQDGQPLSTGTMRLRALKCTRL